MSDPKPKKGLRWANNMGQPLSSIKTFEDNSILSANDEENAENTDSVDNVVDVVENSEVTPEVVPPEVTAPDVAAPTSAPTTTTINRKPFLTYSKDENFLDIVGDKYNIGTDKYVELAYKGLDQFKNNYKTQNIDLFKRVFSIQFTGPVEERIRKLPIPERDEIIAALQYRIQQIELQRGLYVNSLVDLTNNSLKYRLQDLLSKFITMREVPTDLTPLEKSAKIAPQLFSMKEDRDKQLEAVLRIAWYLVNPDKIDSSKLKQFEDIVSTVKLDDIIKKIHTDTDVSSDVRQLDAVNYFDRVRLHPVVDAPTDKNALTTARTQIINTPLETILRDRLQSVLQVFQLHKFIDASGVEQLLGKVRNDSAFTETITDISNNMIDKLNVSLDPLYRFYRIVYYPIYDFMVSSLRPNIQSYNFDVMLRVLKLCMSYVKSSPKTKNGIYKLSGKDIASLIQLTNDVTSDAQYDANYQYIHLLPEFILKQYSYKFISKEEERAKKKKADLVKGTKFKPHLKQVNIVTKQQISIPREVIDLPSSIPNDIDKAELVKQMNEFFTPDSLYMFVQHKRDKSLDVFNLYQCNVDLNEVDATRQCVPFPTVLDAKQLQITKVIPKIRKFVSYTMLALGILIVFKSRIHNDMRYDFTLDGPIDVYDTDISGVPSAPSE